MSDTRNLGRLAPDTQRLGGLPHKAADGAAYATHYSVSDDCLSKFAVLLTLMTSFWVVFTALYPPEFL